MGRTQYDIKKKRKKKVKVDMIAPERCHICGRRKFFLRVEKWGDFDCEEKKVLWKGREIEFYCSDCGWTVEKIKV